MVASKPHPNRFRDTTCIRTAITRWSHESWSPWFTESSRRAKLSDVSSTSQPSRSRPTGRGRNRTCRLVDAVPLENARDRLARLGTLRQPVHRAVTVEAHLLCLVLRILLAGHQCGGRVEFVNDHTAARGRKAEKQADPENAFHAARIGGPVNLLELRAACRSAGPLVSSHGWVQLRECIDEPHRAGPTRVFEPPE